MFNLDKFVNFILVDCAKLSDEETASKTSLYVHNELKSIMKRTPTSDEVTAFEIRLENELENIVDSKGGDFNV